MTDSEYKLSDIERAHLAALVPQEVFKTIIKLMEIECEKFKVALLNADPANPNEVVAAQILAKAAAQFSVGLINRINNEVEVYRNVPRFGDVPQDSTEGILDLGEFTIQEEVLNEF